MKLMKFLFVQIVTILTFCSVKVTDAQEISAEECQTEGNAECSNYTICREETDLYIYPGKKKTLTYSLLVPTGLTVDTSIVVSTSAEMCLILMDVYVLYKDDNVWTQNNTYKPKRTKMQQVVFSYEGTLVLGDVFCNISTGVSTTTVPIVPDPCTYCLIRFAVESLITDITGVSENSNWPLEATLYTETITMAISTDLIIKTSYVYNLSKRPIISTSIPDDEELSVGKGKPFTFQAVFPYPIALYRVLVTSVSSHLRIVSLNVVSAGSHFNDILDIPNIPVVPHDVCIGLGTRGIDFRTLPNFGSYYESNSLDSDTISFEMLILMMRSAVPGHRYRLNIVLEVDGTQVSEITRYVKVTQRILENNVRYDRYQSSLFLAKNEQGSASVTVSVPSLSSGVYSVQASSRRYAGPGGDGLVIAGIGLIDENEFPCELTSQLWNNETSVGTDILNVPGGINIFGYKVYVIAMGDIVEAHSSHELSVTFVHPDESSLEVLKIYFNITTAEIFTPPGGLRMTLAESCRSITPTTHVTLMLHTISPKAYGRMELEVTVPSNQTGQSFMICSGGNFTMGANVFARVQEKFIKRPDDIIEKILVEFPVLANILLVPSDEIDEITPNLVTMPMIGAFIDDSPQRNTQQTSLTARLLSNNKIVWAEELPITKPINHYSDFIVMTSIVKIPNVTASNLTYHYSRNGSYFHQQDIMWSPDNNTYVFEYPKVISSFYFSGPPCTVICNVTAVWQPLANYITIEKDKNSMIRKKVPFILDQDLNTCIALPLPGDSPVVFWLRFTNLSLVGVTSQEFKVRVTGDGIECDRIGAKQLIVGVAGPCHNTQCSVDSDLVFCKFVTSTTVNTLTRCELQCKCPSPSRCTDVQIVLISNNHDDWSLCEISMEDV